MLTLRTLCKVAVLGAVLLAPGAQAAFFPQIFDGTLIVHAYDPQRLVIALDTNSPADGHADEHLLVDLAESGTSGLERGVTVGRVELHENGLLVRVKGAAALAFVLEGTGKPTWAVPADAERHAAAAIVKQPAPQGLTLAQTIEHFDTQALDGQIGAQRHLTEGVRASQRINWERMRRAFARLAPEDVEKVRAAGQLHLFQQDPPADPGGGACSPVCYVGCGAAGPCSSLCSPGLCATCSCVDSQPWCGCVR